MRRAGGLVTAAASVTVIVVLGFGWQVAIWAGHIPAYNLPSPAATLGAMGQNASLLATRCLMTAEGAVAGLAASVLLALALAVTVVRWPALARPVTAYALVIRTLPIVGVAPLVTLVAGRGLGTSVLCVMVVTVFTLYVSAVEGLTAMPGRVTDLAALYGASFPRHVRVLWLPSAWGGLLTGLRIAAPLSVLAAILAEWLTGRPGVGSLMTTAQADQDPLLLWAATVAAAVVGLLAYAVPGAVAVLAARRGLSPDVAEADQR
jgi:ABC-type nitrate/sulfonate/bicarbonate transport system permease component